MGTREYLLDKAKKEGIQVGIQAGIQTGIEKGIKTGIEKGIKTGMEKGKKEEAIAIALEFKKMGLPIADIAKGTGLSIEEVENL
ncbi:hypothetical protein ORI89_08305 [Sphingobacterium sp. UT-1RO-CII-1]|nr:hypothetical protein [Sphingobacterium sp. UT-1RO-CII-1]